MVSSPGGHGRGGANPRCRGFYEYLFIIYCLVTLDLSTRRGALTNLCRLITHMCLYAQENFDTSSMMLC
jgi:hypothetical protein